MTTKRVPTVDSTGKIYDKHLPVRLSETGLRETVQDIVADMLARGTHAGITFTYNDDLGSLSATVTGVGSGGGTGGSTGQDTVLPTTPGNFAATRTSTTSAALTWTASTDNVAVTNYRVYRANITSNTSATATLLATVGPVTNYTDTTLVSGQNYRYEVRASDAAGNLSAAPAVATLQAQSGGTSDGNTTISIIATATPGNGQVTVAWTATPTTIPNLTGWLVGRNGNDASGNGPTQLTVSAGSANYTWTTLTNGTTYTFTVTPVVSGSPVTASTTSVQSQPTAPTPSVVVASATPGDARATLSWTVSGPAISGLSGWRVGRDGTDSTGAGAFSVTISANATQYEFVSLTNGTTYNLSVTPIVNGTAVTSMTATVPAKPVAGTTGGTGGSTGSTPQVTVTAAPADGQVNVTWASSGTITGLTGWLVGRDGTDTNGSGAYSTTDPANTTSRLFDKLNNGSTYTFSVAPVVNGTPGTPATVKATPVAAGTGSTSGSLSATATPGDGTITLSWTVTGTYAGLSGWYVGRGGVDTTGSGAYSTTLTDLTTRSVVFDKLTNGTAYTVFVAPVINGVQGTQVSKTATPNGTSGTGGNTGGSVPSTGGSAAGSGKFAAITMPSRGWFSGSSGAGTDGNSKDFGNWRGDPADFNATWQDTANGGAWGSNPSAINGWTGLADIAIGGPSDYGSAAGGSMDGNLRSYLQRLRSFRTINGKVAPTVIRPFHELNGTWYAWSVNTGNLNNFKATARRWRAIADSAFPEALWAISYNGETTGNASAASMYEDGVWDLIGTDRYNQYPCIGTTVRGVFTSWQDGSSQGSDTNPKGIFTWLQFAKNRGKPLYLPEYAQHNGSNDQHDSDDPYWIKQFIPYVKANAGAGAGKIFGECWFNQSNGEGAKWYIYPPNQMPNVSKAYADLFPVQ